MEDLRIRNYAPRTIATYVRCVALFAKHFGRSPEELAEDQIREYQRYLVDEKKASWAFFNQTVCAFEILLRADAQEGRDSEGDPVPEAGETASRSAELWRGIEAVFVCALVDTPDDSPNHVRGWIEVDGSVGAETR
jgi:hypothetical protein